MSLIDLPDGRRLEVEVSGPDGAPVLAFHHGTPGASTQSAAMARAAHARGLRLLTWSRAGYGASSRRAGRDVASEVADMSLVLDHLGVDDCLVAGWSGGGPHALACGALAPERTRAVLCMAGVAPYDADGLDQLAGMGSDNVEEFRLSIDGEDALRPWLENAASSLGQATPEIILEDMDTILPPVDKSAVTGEFAEFLAATFRQAVSAGIDGWVDDDLAFTRPWGFDLDAIRRPTYVWQGSEDLMVPFAHGEWLAAHVPGATAHLERGEGHLSIVIGALDRMLDELVVHL